MHADARSACFYARRALELAVARADKHDAALKLATLLADKSALDDELKRLRAEVAAAKKVAAAQADTHDYSEAETRDTLIDLLLKEAGWPLADAQDRETLKELTLKPPA